MFSKAVVPLMKAFPAECCQSGAQSLYRLLVSSVGRAPVCGAEGSQGLKITEENVLPL